MIALLFFPHLSLRAIPKLLSLMRFQLQVGNNQQANRSLNPIVAYNSIVEVYPKLYIIIISYVP